MAKAAQPGVLSRRVGVFLSLVVTLLLAMAAGALLLARTISQRSERIQAENAHIGLTDGIHAAAHHLILETNLTFLAPARAASGRPAQMATELQRLLADYQSLHAPYANTDEGREELTLLAGVESLATDLLGLTSRLLASPKVSEPERATAVTHLEEIARAIPDRLEQINNLHRQRADALIEQSRRDLTTILEISVGVALLAALAVVGASWYAARRVTLPLQTLASAATRIAGGDFAQRISVRSRDEIGRLAEAFNAMAAQLQAHEREIQGLATVTERDRLAREVHDGLAQALALIRMRLHGLEEAVARRDTDRGRAIIGELRDVVGRTSQEVRQAIFDLRVMVSRDLGLVPTLTEYLHEFSVDSGIRVDLNADGDAFEFAPDVEVQLIRILQEALTNVRRHARATNVSVRLEHLGDAARLIVTDNGCGFDPALPVGDEQPRFGLVTMRERAEATGGKFRVESRPGNGTTIESTLPLRVPDG